MIHGQVTRTFAMLFCVVPPQVDTCSFFAFPVLGVVMVFFEYSGQMLGVLLANVLHAKVIHDECELDGSLCVLPKAGSSSRFVVACFLQACAEEVIGELSRLF